jgi:hypothetical protein
MARKRPPPVIRIGGDYAAHRRVAYPPPEEFFDAVYHERKGDPAPMQAWMAKIDAVKASIRKPGAK